MSFIFGFASFLIIGTANVFSSTDDTYFPYHQKGFFYDNVPTLKVFSSTYIEKDSANPTGSEWHLNECQSLMDEKRALLVQKGVDIILEEIQCQSGYLYMEWDAEQEPKVYYRYSGFIFFLN